MSLIFFLNMQRFQKHSSGKIWNICFHNQKKACISYSQRICRQYIRVRGTYSFLTLYVLHILAAYVEINQAIWRNEWFTLVLLGSREVSLWRNSFEATKVENNFCKYFGGVEIIWRKVREKCYSVKQYSFKHSTWNFSKQNISWHK